MAAGGSTRKLIEFDPETWQAVTLLSRDSMKTLQELADEAFSRVAFVSIRRDARSVLPLRRLAVS